MTYAFIHQCRHVDEYRLLGSQVNREAAFSEADSIIPAFTETCCSFYNCQFVEPTSIPYTLLDRETRVNMVNRIDAEFDNCRQSTSDYNDFAEQYNLSPILLTEFEHLLIRVYNWVTRAEDFAIKNSPRFFHDVCLSIAQTTLAQVIAMRLSIDLATNSMPAPELAGLVHPDDVSFPASNIPNLREICPDLAKYSLKLSYSPRTDYGIQPLPQNYVRFESVWRSKVQYMDTRPVSYYLSPAIFSSY